LNRFQVPCPVGLEPRWETAIPTGCQRPAYPHHGSRAFAAVARVVLYCADKEPGHFVFGQEKNNLESNLPFALGYHFTKLRSATTRRGRKVVTASRLVWDGPESIRSNASSRQGGWGRARGETPAVMWLRRRFEKLADGESVPSKQIIEEAEHDGFSESTIEGS
jgi:hypothetical protein